MACIWTCVCSPQYTDIYARRWASQNALNYFLFALIYINIYWNALHHNQIDGPWITSTFNMLSDWGYNALAISLVYLKKSILPKYKEAPLWHIVTENKSATFRTRLIGLCVFLYKAIVIVYSRGVLHPSGIRRFGIGVILLTPLWPVCNYNIQTALTPFRLESRMSPCSHVWPAVSVSAVRNSQLRQAR